ncbi:EpsG family protein [Nocardioides sp. CFH 31398]|uniref:EpsG family protein n=1 Tax=Nocardioides sp. CFH 31398 TaxID=2919579 RepID=UPI001F05C1B6|nr:EpsG family protein [Nocardioides sp. CFH 31398]MCH1865998.1 EpsG family protein [Nocardioides sp. CFH 31398]
MTIYVATLAVVFMVILIVRLQQQAALTSSQGRHEIFAGVPRLAVGFIALLLILVAGLRWRTGTDYVQYALDYPRYRDQSLSDVGLLGEPGLNVLVRIAAYVRDDPASMFFTASAVTISLIVWTYYKNSPMFGTSLALYVLVGAWHSSFNGIRQWLACAVLFAGHRLIVERRLGPYLAVVGVATLFHVSALVAVGFYFVPRTRLGLARFLAVGAASVLALTLYEALADAIVIFRDSSTETLLQNAYFQERINPLRVALAAGPLVFYLLISKQRTMAVEGHFYLNMVVVHTAIYVAALNSAYIARFAIFTVVYLPVLIPYLLTMEDRRARALWAGLLLLVYAVFWVFELRSDPSVASYKSYWDR